MAIKKNDFSAVLKKYSSTASYKPQRFFDLGDAFLDATGLPGPAMGHINMFLGHSDTGKTTALIKTAIDCLRKDILPVFIVTEQKWDFSHAKLMGLEYEEEIDSTTGNISYYGNFIFNNDFKWIEQVTDFINELLDIQIKGEINKDICFFWDSVGSIPCKMTYDGKGGKQHNAAVLADKIGMGLNQRITGSRRSEEKYTNTLIICNQPWVELPENIYGQPKIKAKGGEAIWLNSTLVYLFGNEKNAGIYKVPITKNGRTIKIATITKVSVLKNHINGLGYADGKIMITAHDFMKCRTDADKKSSLDEYKKKYAQYISAGLGVSVDEIADAEIGKEILEEL
jgi:hypothetical protein